MKAKKILVVEDNADFSEIICTFLSSYFNQIRSAETVRDAWEIISNWHPDIVIADFHLPDAKATALLGKGKINGIEKFLIMTGDLLQQSALESNVAIDGVLFKPFLLDDLLHEIDNGVEIKS